MALDSGTMLGRYQIKSPVGAGGMGEVYRAQDTRLNRLVAVKVLPEAFSRDTNRLQRFEQEARSLSSLNHPNILSIYDVGQENGCHYLVSELLSGETLRERLLQGPLPLRKALDYAVQIAKGLAGAHEKGITHRDLKPDNIFITGDGHVKILDFGLAKQAPAEADPMDPTQGPVTEAGIVLGTAGYMSPEQVRGRPSDQRSDIFSFGAILYEMITGRRAFQGSSSVEIMNAILKEDPPEISSSGLAVSPGLARLIQRCLDKSPHDRFQSARDVGFALEALSDSSASAPLPAAAAPRPRGWLVWAVGVLALLAATELAWVFLHPAAPSERAEFAIPVDVEVSQPALSADGRMLAYVAPDEITGVNILTVQRVGSSRATVLPGTDGVSYPFWSPDNSYVAYFAGGKLMKVPAAGGPPEVIASGMLNARGGSWSRKNVIIYAPDSGGPLWRVNSDGTNAGPLTAGILRKEDESSHRWPVFLPDGEHFIFWSGNFQNAPDDRVSGIYVSSLQGQSKKLLALARSNPGYMREQLVYVNDRRELVAAPLDLRKWELSGGAKVFSDAVGYQPATYHGSFTAAENGSLIFSPSVGAAFSQLTWYDRSGKESGHVGDVGMLANPSLSPDGRHVAVDVTDVKGHNVDLWIYSVESGESNRFTFNPAEEVNAVWSHDGRTIAYRQSGHPTRLNLKKVSGLEPEKTIVTFTAGNDMLPNSWSLDDKQLLCSSDEYVARSHFVIVSASGDKVEPFLPSKASSNRTGQLSPDGKWLAYASNESGDWEVYVSTFPAGAGKWQVSRGGGVEPRWRGDGKEIFYIGPRGQLNAVPVAGGETFSTSNPVPLFQIRARQAISSTDSFTYDVTKDGQRFLVNRYVKPEGLSPMTIVLNAMSGPGN